MTKLDTLRVLTASSFLALMLATPLVAFEGKYGGDKGSDAGTASGGTGGDSSDGDTSGGTGADAGTGTDAGNTGDKGTDDGKTGDNGTDGDKTGDKGTDPGKGKDPDKGTDPGTDPNPGTDPTPNPSNDGDRNRDQRPGVATNLITCDTDERRLLSSQGSFVGDITNIECQDDGTVLYSVLLSDQFNDEARRVTLKTRVQPANGRKVRVELTDMELKKLIWMNAAH